MAPKWDEDFKAPWNELPESSGVCSIRPVVNAWLKLDACDIITPVDEETIHVPSIAYLITHSSGRRVLFDLGVSCSYLDGMDEDKAKFMKEKFQTEISDEMANILVKDGVDLGSIESVIISHRHWDHVGTPSTIKGCKFMLTPDEAANLPTSLPEAQLTKVNFDASRKYASFDGSYDVFGDGSCCLVPMLGHTSGHMGCLVKTKAGTVALAADSCHSPKIIASEKYRMSLYGENNDRSFYDDYEEASRTVTRLRECERHGVKVLLAHDPERWSTWSQHKVGVGSEI